MGEITISVQRYNELITLETRVSVAVERVMNNKFTSIEDILWILNTDLAVELAQEMYMEREKL